MLADRPVAHVCGIAKRLGKRPATAPNVIVMKIVTCQDCGAQFAIGHDISLRDADLATKQAVWLSEQLVWDHIQENKHRGSIVLPRSEETNSSRRARDTDKGTT